MTCDEEFKEYLKYIAYGVIALVFIKILLNIREVVESIKYIFNIL